MELVVDANVIISSLISHKGKTCEMLFSDKLNLYIPEYLLDELKRHKEEISTKSGLSFEKIDLLFSLISLNFKVVPLSEFKEFIKKASDICPDKDDTEYFALALKLNCPLWSNDKRLKQDSLKVLTTSEVIKLI
jgi:predicted nucleic acid-binding protein